MKKLLNKKNLFFSGLCVFIFLFSQIIHMNPAIPLFLIILYFCFYNKFLKLKNANLTNLSFLFLISFAIGHALLREGLPFYFTPILIIPMLSVLLFSTPEAAYFLSLTTSLSLASLCTEPFKIWFIFMVGCSCAILLVNKTQKRTIVIQAGFICGLVQVVSLIFFEHF